MFKLMKEKKGFTLIELIIVIAILAILAMIGLPMIGQYMQDADLAANNATSQVIGRAAEAYIAAHPTEAAPAYGDLDAYLNANATGLGDVTLSVDGEGNVSVDGPGTGDVMGHYPAEEPAAPTP